MSTLKRINFNMEAAEAEQVRTYGQRYIDYRQRFKDAAEFSYEPTFPLYLMLEQTYRCNLHCPSCIQGSEVRDEFDTGISHMSRQLFHTVVLEGEKHNCPSISMHSIDEPLLVKDLPKRVAYAKKHGFMDILMSTNATRLRQYRIIKLIESGITHMMISIDAATEETYDKVRPSGSFQDCLNAIDFIREYRKENKTCLPIIRASFARNRLNEHETQMFIERFSGLVDYVDIQSFQTYRQINSRLIPKGATPLGGFRCSEVWRKLVIRANGDVIPCCSFYCYEVLLGNLSHSTLHGIFNSPRMKRMRHDLSVGIYPTSACKDCSESYYPIELEGKV